MPEQLDRRTFARLAVGAAGAAALIPGLVATASAQQAAPTAIAKQTATQAAADALLDAAEAKAHELGVHVAIAIVDEGLAEGVPPHGQPELARHRPGCAGESVHRNRFPGRRPTCSPSRTPTRPG